MVSSSDEAHVAAAYERRHKRSHSYDKNSVCNNRRKKYMNIDDDDDEMQHHSKWDSPERERRKQRSRSNDRIKDREYAREKHKDRPYDNYKTQKQQQQQQQQQQHYQQHLRTTRRNDDEHTEYNREKTRYDNKSDANYNRNDEQRHYKHNSNNSGYNKNRYERNNYVRDNNRPQQQQRNYDQRDTNRENKQNKRYQRRYSNEKHEKSYDWGKRTDKMHSGSGGGGGDGDGSGKNAQTVDKQKPNFGLSGALTEETNKVNGIVIKYSEPLEARKPKRRWRLYPFKGETPLPTLHIHRQSCFLVGRDRKVVDLAVDHPSCSKQHAALQYRLVSFERVDGTTGKRVRPYLIDLESANGTFLNNKKIEARKYYELIEKDVIKFGFSTREYVLLHENSKEDEEDDDVFIKREAKDEPEDEPEGPNP